MPAALQRVCSGAGGRCQNLVTSGLCPDCQRQKQQRTDYRRGTFRERGYTSTWDRLSRYWLKTHPFCGQRKDGTIHTEHSRCAQRHIAEGRSLEVGYNAWADVTDHIIPISKGGELLATANLQSLCTACNVAKGDK